MNTLKRHHLARVATAVLALSALSARTMAAEGFEFNLMQYEFSLGQGRTQHSFYFSNFAPGGRFGDFAFDDTGTTRMPVYSTNEKQWTLLRAASDGSDGSLAGNIANGILAVGALVAMGYGIAAQAKSFGDAFDFDIEIPTQSITIPSATSSSSPKPAKK